MIYQILGTQFYTPPAPGLDVVQHVVLAMPNLCIVFVAIASGPKPGDWKCYAGFGAGDSEEADAQNAAAHGVKVDRAVACAMFPDLLPDGFKF